MSAKAETYPCKECGRPVNELGLKRCDECHDKHWAATKPARMEHALGQIIAEYSEEPGEAYTSLRRCRYLAAHALGTGRS